MINILFKYSIKDNKLFYKDIDLLGLVKKYGAPLEVAYTPMITDQITKLKRDHKAANDEIAEANKVHQSDIDKIAEMQKRIERQDKILRERHEKVLELSAEVERVQNIKWYEKVFGNRTSRSSYQRHVYELYA